MATRLILCARVGRRRLEVTEPLHGVYTVDKPPVGQIRTEVRYRGAGVRDGRLITFDTEDGAIAAAVRIVRRHNPKAQIHVTACSPCRVGSVPGLECKHVAPILPASR